MKVLFLSQGKDINDHPGWHDALVKLKNEKFISDFLNIPFYGYAQKHGWDAFYEKVVKLCKDEKFDVVYFHHFHSKKIPSPRACIAKIRQLNERIVIITSCGDMFSYNWLMPHYPKSFKIASALSDIAFTTQMGKAADKMEKWGVKNIVLSPLGICQVRFKFLQDISTIEPKYDVVFMGSKTNIYSFNFFHRAWWRALLRIMVVKKLHKSFKNGFALFGKRWNFNFAMGSVPFNEQQKRYLEGRVAVDAPPSWCTDYYSSNRHLIQMASAVPTVMFRSPRIEKLYRENEHVYYVTLNTLIPKIKEILLEDKDRIKENAINASKYVMNRHTQYHRMKFKLDTVKRYIANNYKLNVEFPFFLPEVDLNEEMKYAIRVNSNIK